ncbi:hypothetical protein CEXT_805661 [Caerostris extrusa]|uniref:Uncharacterized protein n=1 Tax=Caerostris extrusa TaxID=172846 RepID=A0AAV4WD16_CAEEX|nr:hypothetical protein CEXT_805661 [Caerostris extrusa]
MTAFSLDKERASEKSSVGRSGDWDGQTMSPRRKTKCSWSILLNISSNFPILLKPRSYQKKMPSSISCLVTKLNTFLLLVIAKLYEKFTKTELGISNGRISILGNKNYSMRIMTVYVGSLTFPDSNLPSSVTVYLFYEPTVNRKIAPDSQRYLNIEAKELERGTFEGNDVICSIHPIEEKAVGERAPIGWPVHACPDRGASPSTCVGPGPVKSPGTQSQVFHSILPTHPSHAEDFLRSLFSDFFYFPPSNMLVGRAFNLQVLLALSMALVVRGAYLIDFSRVFHHNLANVKREGRKVRFF